MPCGRRISRSKAAATVGPKPKRSKGMNAEERSRSRMTTDSPWTVGTVDTRMSTRRPDAVHERLQRRGGAVAGLDGFENGLGWRYAEPDGHSEALAEALAEIVQQHGVGGIGCGHADRRTLHRDRTGDILAQVFGGE